MKNENDIPSVGIQLRLAVIVCPAATGSMNPSSTTKMPAGTIAAIHPAAPPA